VEGRTLSSARAALAAFSRGGGRGRPPLLGDNAHDILERIDDIDAWFE
jgi:hypothetical protein